MPIQWMRWSCQIAVCDPDTRCHRGGVDGPVPIAIAGTGGRARTRSIEIRRRRTQVLVETARPDAQVRLVVVAEHDDVDPRAIRELELVAEVDDADRHAGDRR